MASVVSCMPAISARVVAPTFLFDRPDTPGDVLDDFTSLNLVGRSTVFLAALRTIRRAAACDATVLIHGEIGTGKELAARAVHSLSARRNQPFIPVDCGGVRDSLFEDELFGHVRGTLADEKSESVGLIASAEGGTLFLDEVQALTVKAQAALLRFLQDGTYRRRGGDHLIKANVRVVAASNACLIKMATRGTFRADLMYRLTAMSLDLPPLRDRDGDIPLLAQHFVARFNAQFRMNRTLSPDSLAALCAYTWPSNVRELENLLHREVLLSRTDSIELASALRLFGAAHPLNRPEPGGPGWHETG